MMGSYIKYFTLIVCSFYIYVKLLNLKKASKNNIIDLVFASAISYSIYYIWLFCQPLTLPVLIVFSYIYITLATKTELGLSITTIIISFGISFAFFSISLVLVATIFSFINVNYSDDNGRILLVFVAFLQLLLCCMTFRFRRLKSGMPYLRSKGGGNIGVIISTVLLCCFFIISNANNSESIYFIISVIFVLLCGVLILFWWRGRLEKAYIEKLRIDEIQSLRDTIDEKEEQIENFKQHNDFLGKIIHKDNKLIPTMELVVREYLQTFERENDADIRLKGQMLLEQLKTISCERSGIIAEYQASNEKLPLSGVFPIDALMTYMFNKARENGIKYEFTISGSVKYMVENVIYVSDLRTLLADLIENAVIATKKCDKKEILVSLGIFEGYYMINVFDSGISFEPETIINFGRKKSTTHADTGGSGIGLLTVSEILSIYGASFIIEEFSETSNFFTKNVSVKFDNLDQYIVKSKTDKEICAISVREDLIVNI